mgnify:CR=1 FL=1
MSRRDSFDFRGYGNMRDMEDEYEAMRIDHISKNPRYKTKEEYNAAFKELDRKYDSLRYAVDDHITGETDCLDWYEIQDQFDAVQKEIDALEEEYNLVFPVKTKEEYEAAFKELDAQIRCLYDEDVSDTSGYICESIHDQIERLQQEYENLKEEYNNIYPVNDEGENMNKTDS